MRLVSLLLAALAVLPAAAQTDVYRQEAEEARAQLAAEMRAELDRRQLSEAEKEYVVGCVVYERPPADEPCSLVRLMELMTRDEIEGLDPTEREPEPPADPDRPSGEIQPLDPSRMPDPTSGPVLQHTLAPPRYSVAFDRDGEWAVSVGRPTLTALQANVVTSDGLREELRTFVAGLAGRRVLAFAPQGAAAGVDQTGSLHVAPRRIPSAASCTGRLNRLAALAGDPDPDVSLAIHPETCEWVLASGTATASAPRLDGFARAVQARLDAGETPALAFTPDGVGTVAVTDSRVIRGGGVVPYAFEELVRSAQRDSFQVAGRGTLRPIGRVHAVAFHPERYAVVDGQVTGFVLLGESGYRARGVDAALCDAIEAVTGYDPGAFREAVCRDAVGGDRQPDAVPFAFAPERPKLAVVVHGITPRPGADPKHNVGTVHHTTYYWGGDFLGALIGRLGAETYLLREDTPGTSQPLAPSRWRDCADEFDDADDPDYLACQAQTPWPYSPSQATRATPGRLAPVLLDRPDPTSGAPFMGAMVSFRDGSVRLREQVGETVRQVYETYQHHFGDLPADHQPQLYFVVHSFGGIVARTLLSLGSDETFAALQSGDPTADADLRQRAAFLRDRTVLLTTLSTPHLGSPLIDLSTDLDRALRTFEPLPIGTATDFVGGDREVYADIRALAASGATPNTTFLHPARAQRGDGSPVPIYTLGGRSPGGAYFSTHKQMTDGLQSRASITDLLMGRRHGMEAAGQFIFDRLLGRLGYGETAAPWGRVGASGEPLGDLLTVPHQGPSPPVRSGAFSYDNEIAAEILDLDLRRYGYRWNPDGVYDSDGLVGFASSHGLDLVGDGSLDYFEHGQTWAVETASGADSVADGSWYRLFRPEYGDLFPWDRDNHGSLMFNVGNGLYLHNTLLRHAGPRVGGALWSGWDSGFSAPFPEPRTVEVEVTRLKAIGETAEEWWNDGAEWRLYIQIGRRITVREPGTGNDWRGSAVAAQRVHTSVVPIRISVVEIDGNGDPDDPVHLSPETGREPFLVYLDTRTGRLHGDAEVALGQPIVQEPPPGNDNRARIELTVTVR